MDWFLCDNGLRHERVKGSFIEYHRRKEFKDDAKFFFPETLSESLQVSLESVANNLYSVLELSQHKHTIKNENPQKLVPFPA